MNQTDFTLDTFKNVIAELFSVSQADLVESYNLALLIKDSIDLGELVAILKSRYNVNPVHWDAFRTNTTLVEVFNNFK